MNRDADLVVDLLNTLDIDGGTDALDHRRGWTDWCAAHDLEPAGDPATARRVRAALRDAVAGVTTSDVVVDATLTVTGGHPTVVPVDAAGHVLVAAARLVDSGEWHRMKLCTDDTCRWAFFDRSRNRSRAWCSMEVCGNRAKARSFRRRARSHSD